MEWENVFANPVSDKGLISELYVRNFYNSGIKRQMI